MATFRKNICKISVVKKCLCLNSPWIPSFMAFEKCITIIGGGFSGTLTAVQLLRQCPFPIGVKLINAGYPVAKGVAYSSQDPLHLLNVRANRMSAFPHIPLHFANWLKTQPDAEQFCQPGETVATAFMPRQVYGRYLDHVLEHAIETIPAGSKFELIEDEALAIEQLKNNKYRISLRNRPAYETEKVILALGNFEPEPLKGISEEVKASGLYFGNPWLPIIPEDLDQHEPVLLIGTGLTMIDVVLSLLEKDFKGPIYAVSTKGFLPMVHKQTNPYPDIREELKPPYDLGKLYPAVKKHIRKANKQGSSCEALIDTFRPQTQEIWQGLSYKDKKQFLRHLSSLWGVFRHRISPQVAVRIQAARDSGQLQIIAGRLKATQLVSGQLEATIKEKGQPQSKRLTVQRLINCTGPQMNFARIESPLVQSLLAQNLIRPDVLHLGLQALPDGRLLQPDGKPSCSFFTIGPALRGALWESTAVPEISEQAAHLAQAVLHAFLPDPETKTENTKTQPEK